MPDLARKTMTPEEEAAWAEKAAAGELWGVVEMPGTKAEMRRALKALCRPFKQAGWRHGTPNGYDRHGCRCPECRTARSAYRKSLRARR